MTDKFFSQMHNPFIAPMIDAWKKATDAQLARVQSFYDNAAAWESRGAEQTRGAIDESARLMRETVLYTTQISSEWRKQSLEAMRSALSMMTPPL
jgi:hypothetical protein